MKLTIEEIAESCHEMNFQYCSIIGDPATFWDDLSYELKESICAGVQCAIDGRTPEESHENWLMCRSQLGWKFGERDDEKKTHPNMVAYDELPESQKAKDKIFLAVVNGLK